MAPGEDGVTKRGENTSTLPIAFPKKAKTIYSGGTLRASASRAGGVDWSEGLRHTGAPFEQSN